MCRILGDSQSGGVDPRAQRLGFCRITERKRTVDVLRALNEEKHSVKTGTDFVQGLVFLVSFDVDVPLSSKVEEGSRLLSSRH